MRETLTLNTHEQKRVMILNRILAGQLSVAEAAPLLDRSHRQVQRMLAAYRKEGAEAVVHGNRGRKPKHTITAQMRQQVIVLAQTTYQGCNQQHLRDLLQEREGIRLSRSSVHRILQAAGLLAEPKRRKPQHRRRRKRYGQEGMLVQIDGSLHAWLGERGPWLSLLAAIDDATGKIVAAVFREQEDGQGYFLLVRQMIAQYGRPLALYHDRHGIFTHTSIAREADSVQEQLAGKQEPTQFGRLAQANTVLAAYLPRFNAQFAVPPAQVGTAYRPFQAGVKVEEVFCFKYVRTVALDNTVQLGEHRLQLLPDKERRSYARAHVEVHERLDGSLAVYYAGRCLVSTPAPLEAPVLRARAGRLTAPAHPSLAVAAEPTSQDTSRQSPAPAAARRGSTPGPDHHWRKKLLPPQARSVS